MKSGTELAMESSDIVLMKSNPAGVAEAVQLGPHHAAHHQAESFLGFLLQHHRHSVGRRVFISRLRPYAESHDCRRGDEFEFPVRRIQFPEAAGVHPTPGGPGEIGRPLPHRHFPFRRAAAGPGPACVRGLRRRPACGPVHPPVLHGSPPAGRRWCGCPRMLSEPGNDGRPGPLPAGSA